MISKIDKRLKNIDLLSLKVRKISLKILVNHQKVLKKEKHSNIHDTQKPLKTFITLKTLKN